MSIFCTSALGLLRALLRPLSSALWAGVDSLGPWLWLPGSGDIRACSGTWKLGELCNLNMYQLKAHAAVIVLESRFFPLIFGTHVTPLPLNPTLANELGCLNPTWGAVTELWEPHHNYRGSAGRALLCSYNTVLLMCFWN